jgi:hypothetical protein
VRRSQSPEGRRRCSAELLGQPNEDALRAADVAEPIDVLVLRDLPDELGAMRLQTGKDVLECSLVRSVHC